jgi:hypothetical protein
MMRTEFPLVRLIPDCKAARSCAFGAYCLLAANDSWRGEEKAPDTFSPQLFAACRRERTNPRAGHLSIDLILVCGKIQPGWTPASDGN